MRMCRLREFLLVCCLCSSIRSGLLGHLVNGDQAGDFLNAKEAQVLLISNQTTINDASTCELVASCSDSEECTRGACAPLLSDNLTCTFVSQNKACYQDPITLSGGYCNDIRVNLLRSYVRTPLTTFSSGVSNEVPPEMRNTICSQRKLDPLFLTLQKLQDTSQYYFNFYFGGVDGSFRFYPGLEVKDCFNYDPRIRPWYTGAFSVLKDVVFLIDSGYTMSNNLASATYQATIFEGAQNLTKQILMTLTSKDRGTVISFDSSSEATPISSSYRVPDVGLNTSEPVFQQLLAAVQDSTVSSSNGGSNFTAGLNQAISIFNEGLLLNALKIVIIFTDGVSSPSLTELASVVNQIQQQSIRLFIYKIGDSANAALGTLACRVQGYEETLNQLNLVQNPLFAVNSFFSFLARSQKNSSDGSRPFWQRVYTDYGNLGSVITVANSVMSADGSQLIGVAGIDVQTGGLPLGLRSLLDTNLVSSRRIQISTNAVGASFSECSPTYNESQGQCNSDFLSPLCAQDDNKSNYTDLVCCADCGIIKSQKNSGSNSSPTNLVVIVVVFSALAVLAAVSLSLLLWFRFSRVWEQPPDGIVNFLKIRKFSYETLAKATNTFSEENTLGKGTFGIVFVGTLDDGTKVAVKKLSYQPNYGLGDFEAEIKVLAIANHTNLVALKGFCLEQHHLLVYEFVENGDLDNWLFGKPEKSGEILPWEARVVIAKGMAKGLAYLHEDLQNHQKVCHSDIKPANILLDSEFNPKVADFGMAKLFSGGIEMFPTGGTVGYIAPEIMSGACSSTKTDVYSYGMVLLELVSGRKCSDSKIRNLPMWASMKVAEQTSAQVIDPLLGKLDEEEEELALRLIRIGLLCSSIDPDFRPDMSAVVKMIEGFLAVRSVPPSMVGGSLSNVNSTFSSESLGMPSISDTFAWDQSWNVSEAIKNLQMRSAITTPAMSIELSDNGHRDNS